MCPKSNIFLFRLIRGLRALCTSKKFENIVRRQFREVISHKSVVMRNSVIKGEGRGGNSIGRKNSFWLIMYLVF